MWEIGIGAIELGYVLGLCLCMFAVNKRFRGYAIGVVACFAVAAALTPPDPLSAICIGLLLTIAFAGGALTSRRTQTA